MILAVVGIVGIKKKTILSLLWTDGKLLQYQYILSANNKYAYFFTKDKLVYFLKVLLKLIYSDKSNFYKIF